MIYIFCILGGAAVAVLACCGMYAFIAKSRKASERSEHASDCTENDGAQANAHHDKKEEQTVPKPITDTAIDIAVVPAAIGTATDEQEPVEPAVFKETEPDTDLFIGEYVIYTGNPSAVGNPTKYSCGKIVSFDMESGQLTVCYKDTNKTYQYQYPKDFLDKRLKFADPDKYAPSVVAGVSAVPTTTPQTGPRSQPQPLPPADPVQPVWVESMGQSVSMRKGVPIKYRDVFGSRSREVYQHGCRAFGWDACKITCFGHGTKMYAKHATPADESVWMIAHHRWITGPTRGDTRWYNVVGREMIHEYWYVSQMSDEILRDLHYDFSKRITFGL